MCMRPTTRAPEAAQMRAFSSFLGFLFNRLTLPFYRGQGFFLTRNEHPQSAECGKVSTRGARPVWAQALLTVSLFTFKYFCTCTFL